MSDAAFQVGDVVVMRNGMGPSMVVVQIDDPYVVCEWFADKKSECQSRKFIAAALMKYEHALI